MRYVGKMHESKTHLTALDMQCDQSLKCAQVPEDMLQLGAGHVAAVQHKHQPTTIDKARLGAVLNTKWRLPDMVKGKGSEGICMQRALL